MPLRGLGGRTAPPGRGRTRPRPDHDGSDNKKRQAGGYASGLPLRQLVPRLGRQETEGTRLPRSGRGLAADLEGHVT